MKSDQAKIEKNNEISKSEWEEVVIRSEEIPLKLIALALFMICLTAVTLAAGFTLTELAGQALGNFSLFMIIIIVCNLIYTLFFKKD